MPEDAVSLRALAEELTLNRHYLAGLVDGLGIRTYRGPRNAKNVRRADVPKIRKRIELLAAASH